jgi:hypothetical protein
MPLAILLIGGAIALWGVQRETKRSEEIRQTLLLLCRDIRAGNDVTQRIRLMSAAPDPLLMNALERASWSANSSDEFSIEVTPGDVEDNSAFAGTATHVAMIRVNGSNVLGLRIRHDGGDAPIKILGHFSPAPH